MFHVGDFIKLSIFVDWKEFEITSDHVKKNVDQRDEIVSPTGNNSYHFMATCKSNISFWIFEMLLDVLTIAFKEARVKT